MREWLRVERGNKSQAQVANECGISQQAYSAFENNTKRPSPDTAKKIAEALGFDWKLFFEEEKDAG